MTKLFVSYRQADNADFVYRIRDWLMNRYGKANVFIDFDNLPPFTVFENVIRQRIADSDAVLVIVGPRWLDLLNQKAADGDDDYVKIEIEAAFARDGLIVAPVLIRGANMPAPRDLPPSLRPLCKINAARLTDGGKAFEGEITAMMDAIDAAIGGQNQPPPAAQSAPKSDEPRTAEEFVERARVRIDQGEYEGALDDANEALRLKPSYIWAHFRRGMAHERMGHYELALSDYNEVIRLNPQYAFAYYGRGVARARLGDYRGAISDYNETIQLNPQNSNAYAALASAEVNMGIYDKAISDGTESIHLNPQNSYAYYNRAAAYQMKGDYALANADYQHYLDLGGTDRETVERFIRENDEKLKKKR